MPDDKKYRTFVLDDETIDIPIETSEMFLKDYPEAKEYKSFILEGDTVDIPIENTELFLKDYPESKLTYGTEELKPEPTTSQIPYAPETVQPPYTPETKIIPTIRPDIKIPYAPPEQTIIDTAPEGAITIQPETDWQSKAVENYIGFQNAQTKYNNSKKEKNRLESEIDNLDREIRQRSMLMPGPPISKDTYELKKQKIAELSGVEDRIQKEYKEIEKNADNFQSQMSDTAKPFKEELQQRGGLYDENILKSWKDEKIKQGVAPLIVEKAHQDAWNEAEIKKNVAQVEYKTQDKAAVNHFLKYQNQKQLNNNAILNTKYLEETKVVEGKIDSTQKATNEQLIKQYQPSIEVEINDFTFAQRNRVTPETTAEEIANINNDIIIGRNQILSNWEKKIGEEAQSIVREKAKVISKEADERIKNYYNDLQNETVLNKEFYRRTDKFFKENNKEIWDNGTTNQQQTLLREWWKQTENKLMKENKPPEFISNAKDEFFAHYGGQLSFDKGGEPTIYAIQTKALDMEVEVDLRLKDFERQLSEIEKQRLPPEYRGMEGSGRSAYKAKEISPFPNEKIQKRYDYIKEQINLLQQAKIDLDEIQDMTEENRRGLIDGFLSLRGYQYVPYVSSLFKFSEGINIYKTSEKVKKGFLLTPAERMVMDGFAMNNQIQSMIPTDMSFNIGAGAAIMGPYIGEFITSYGGMSLTKSVITKALLNKFGKEFATGLVGKGIAFGIGGIAQASLNPQMTAVNTIERMLPEVQLALSDDGAQLDAVITGNGENFGEAFLKGYGTTITEFLTENSGGFLGESVKKMSLPLRGLLENDEWFKRVVLGSWMNKKGLKTIGEALEYAKAKKIGYHGVLEEFGEEKLNEGVLPFITGEDYAPSIKRDFETLGTITLFGGLVGGLKYAVVGKPRSEYIVNGKQFTRKSFIDLINDEKFQSGYISGKYPISLEVKNDNFIQSQINDLAQLSRMREVGESIEKIKAKQADFIIETKEEAERINAEISKQSDEIKAQINADIEAEAKAIRDEFELAKKPAIPEAEVPTEGAIIKPEEREKETEEAERQKTELVKPEAKGVTEVAPKGIPSEMEAIKKEMPTEISGLKLIEKAEPLPDGTEVFRVEGDRFLTRDGKEIQVEKEKAPTEKIELVTDYAEQQKLRNHLIEGEEIVRTGSWQGRKYSKERIEMVKIQNEKIRKQLGIEPKPEIPAIAPKSILTQETDLKGDKKEIWMGEMIDTEYENKIALERQNIAISDAKNDLEKIKAGNESIINEYVHRSRYKKIVKGDKAVTGKSLDEHIGKYQTSSGGRTIIKTAKKIALDAIESKIKTKPAGISTIRLNEAAVIFSEIKKALLGGKYQQAISEGRMTATDAKTIISSAGLEVPKDILEMAEKEITPKVAVPPTEAVKAPTIAQPKAVPPQPTYESQLKLLEDKLVQIEKEKQEDLQKSLKAQGLAEDEPEALPIKQTIDLRYSDKIKKAEKDIEEFKKKPIAPEEIILKEGKVGVIGVLEKPLPPEVKETPEIKVPKELTEQEIRQQKLDEAKAKVGESIQDFFSSIGAIKEITGEEAKRLLPALKKVARDIADLLILQGEYTAERVIEELKKQVGKWHKFIDENKDEIFSKAMEEEKAEATGIFGEDSPHEKAKKRDLKPIEYPELVQLAKEISGNVPFRKKIKNKLGYFSSTKNNIAINDELFKKGNEEDLLKVIAHEIGHMIDYMPEKTMSRGNILGRIASLKHFLLKELPFKPGEAGELTEEDIIRFTKIAKELSKDTIIEKEIDEEIETIIEITPQDILDIWNSVDAGSRTPELLEYIKTLSTADKKSITKEALKGKIGKLLKDFIITKKEKTGKKIKIKELIKGNWKQKLKEIIEEEIRKRKLWKEREIYNELYSLSKYWRPFEEADSTPKQIQYRKSSKEIYADAISVLLNSPGTLEEKAPKFMEAFFNYLDNKPDVKLLYEHLQDLLNNPDNIQEKRLAGILEDFKRAKEKTEKILSEEEKDKHSLWDKILMAIISQNHAVLGDVKEVNEFGITISEKETIQHKLELLKFTNNKIWLFLDKVQQEVIKPLNDIGVDNDMFGALLMAERNLSQRAFIANPKGFQEKASEELKKYILRNFSKEKIDFIQSAIKKFHDIIYDIAEKGFEAGIYSKEIMDEKIKPNKDSYVTFRVIEYIHKNYISPSIKKMSGTHQAIENPLVSTMLKTSALLKTIERQKGVNAVENWLRKDFPDEIFDSEEINIEGINVGFKERNKTERIEFYKNGKWVGIDVDPYIAQIFEYNPNDISILIKPIQYFNKFFKPVVTTFNLGWALYSNVIRDNFRTFRSVMSLMWADPKNRNISFAKIPIEYLYNLFKAMPESKKFVDEQLTPLLKEMLEEGALSKNIFGVYDPKANDNLQSVYQAYNLVPKQLTWKEKIEQKNKIYKYALKPFTAIMYAGSFGEANTKIAGYSFLRNKGYSAEKAGLYTRNYMGTPNYYDKGSVTKTTNEVLVFSNVIFQGIKSDIKLMTSPNIRSGYWMAMTMQVGVPSIVMAMAMAGLFGDDIKKLYDDIPEYDKTNYYCIPYGRENITNKVKYIRIPIDEIGRLIHALIIKSQEAIIGELKEVKQIINMGVGMIPSPTPLIKIANAWIDYIQNKNPYDSFYGKNIIPPNDFKAGYGLKDMIKWTLKTSGLSSIVYGFEYDITKKSTTEYILSNIPVIGRAIKYGDASLTEAMYKYLNDLEKDRAKRIIKEKEIINKYLQVYFSNKQQEDPQIKNKIKMDVFEKENLNDEEEKRFESIMKKYNIGKILGEISPFSRILNVIEDAKSNEDKIKILRKYEEMVDENEFEELIKLGFDNKIISKEVKNGVAVRKSIFKKIRSSGIDLQSEATRIAQFWTDDTDNKKYSKEKGDIELKISKILGKGSEETLQTINLLGDMIVSEINRKK